MVLKLIGHFFQSILNKNCDHVKEEVIAAKPKAGVRIVPQPVER